MTRSIVEEKIAQSRYERGGEVLRVKSLAVNGAVEIITNGVRWSKKRRTKRKRRRGARESVTGTLGTWLRLGR